MRRRASATVEATRRFGVPMFGTMAHSFIEAHDDEVQAFRNFAHARPQNLVLLIDTYDVPAAIDTVIELVPALAADGIRVAALLDKKPARIKDVELHHVGFEIPKEFVIGYGLDYDEQYRNLPYVGILSED